MDQQTQEEKRRALLMHVQNQATALAMESGDMRPLYVAQVVDTDPGPSGPYVQCVLSWRFPL